VNHILNQMKSAVVTKKRSHDTIRKYVEETDDGFRIVLPPPLRRVIVIDEEITSEPDHDADIDAARRATADPLPLGPGDWQGQYTPPSNTNQGRSSSRSPSVQTHYSQGAYSRGMNSASGSSRPDPPGGRYDSHDFRVGKKEVRAWCRHKWGSDWHLNNKDTRKKEAKFALNRAQSRTQRSPSGTCGTLCRHCGNRFDLSRNFDGRIPLCDDCRAKKARQRQQRHR